MTQREWQKQNTTQILMRLNNSTDKDILSKLDTVESKQGYIKGLIREDIYDRRTESEERS